MGMAAGLATLQKIEKEKIYEKLGERSESFFAALQKEALKLDTPWQLAHHSSLFWWHRSLQSTPRSVADLPAGHGEAFRKFFHSCLSRGLYLAPSGFEVGFLSGAHSEEILQEAAQIMVEALREYEV